MENVSVQVSIPVGQLSALQSFLQGTDDAVIARGSLDGLTKKMKTGKRKSVAATVSPDEDEDFGKEELDEDDLELADNADEDEEKETKPAKKKKTLRADSEEDEEEENESVDWDTLKAAINKWGTRNEASMGTILSAHNIKSAIELKKHPKKWDAIYTKVKFKLDNAKKR